MSKGPGFNSIKDPTPEVIRMCEYVKPQVEEILHRPLPVWEVLKFAEQPTAGKNYRIKVHIGNGAYIHLELFKPLPHRGNKPIIRGVSEGMTQDGEF